MTSSNCCFKFKGMKTENISSFKINIINGKIVLLPSHILVLGTYFSLIKLHVQY